MRIKKVLFGTCMISLVGFSINGCSENLPEYDNTIATSDTTTMPASVLPKAVAESSGIAYKTSNSIINFDTAKVLNVNPMIKVPTQPISAKNTGALNPAHGKPGHRCDLAVGAPLNSSPKAPDQQPQSTISPLVQPSSPKLPISTTGSGRINPPHGEPGHNCAIAVGQPLK